jgi:hypothetical protein
MLPERSRNRKPCIRIYNWCKGECNTIAEAAFDKAAFKFDLYECLKLKV